jgi:hypothetical protein
MEGQAENRLPLAIREFYHVVSDARPNMQRAVRMYCHGRIPEAFSAHQCITKSRPNGIKRHGDQGLKANTPAATLHESWQHSRI